MIISINNENKILKCETNINNETNMFQLDILTGEDVLIENTLLAINTLSWEDKKSLVSDEFNVNVEDMSNEVICDHIVRYLNHKILIEEVIDEDICFRERNLNSLNQFQGESVNIVKNLCKMRGLELPDEFLDVIRQSISLIEPEEDYSKIKNNRITEILSTDYRVYTGENEKYRGCIGKANDARVDVIDGDVEVKMSFKGKTNNLGRKVSFWAKQSNLKEIALVEGAK